MGGTWTAVPRECIRSRLVSISQDSCIFTGSIRFNLDPWGHHADAELTAALHKVGLVDAVQALGGLDGEINMESLSHGQKQLFSLARAILRQGKVVILDEPTSEYVSRYFPPHT